MARNMMVVSAFGLAALLSMACGPGSAPSPTPSPTPEAHALTGTFSFLAIALNGGADGTNTCDDLSPLRPLKPSWSDIHTGTQLIIHDGSGAIIGTGSLTAEPASEWDEYTTVECPFSFVVPGVRRADFYRLSIGNHAGPTYSLAELEAMDWKMELSGD